MQFSSSLKMLLVSGVTASCVAVPSAANSSAPASSIASPVTSDAPAPTSGSGSSVPIGVAIKSCTVPGTFALTFDDGPFNFTDHVLDLLKEAGVRATFFVNGQNWGNINDYQSTVNRILAEGHQLGSHTNRHPDLSTLSDADIIADMTTLEDTLINLVGKYPTYMRPPYFSYSADTLSILGALGYHVIDADLDTDDWRYNNLGNTTSVGIFEEKLAAGGSIALAHDVHQNTAEVLVPAFLKVLAGTNLTAVPVGACLGDPEENWYLATRTSTPTATGAPAATLTITSTVTPTGVIGPDGACAGTEGYVCLAGTCCSQYNFCGVSNDHCGTGCQNAFGVCA
ncbi:hypothetical protein ACHAQA_003888 [Verticillium albo-atrum]